MAKNKISKKIGVALAYFQAAADEVVTFGFRKMAELSKSRKRREYRGFFGKVVSGLRRTAGFFGEVGQSFYEKYEEIKARKLNDKD